MSEIINWILEQYFGIFGLEELEGPSQSLDLNPIKHCWVELEHLCKPGLVA